MAKSHSNDFILEQLKRGTAKFEIVSIPVSPADAFQSFNLFSTSGSNFFARIGASIESSAMRKLEHFSVQKITGDGRCMFRALVKGMAGNKGVKLSPREERDDADELRMAVKEVICDSDKERRQYEKALIAITVDESLNSYCQRIKRPDFWGGESELLILSKLCCQPIIVYIPEHEHTRGGWGSSGYIPIAEYGIEFKKGSNKGKPKEVCNDKMIAAAMTRMMNGVWKARNMRIFREEDISSAHIVQEAIWYLKMKFGAIKFEDCAEADLSWLREMRILN